MKSIILAATIIISCAAGVFAQNSKSVGRKADANTGAALDSHVSANSIDAGTRVATQLQSAIDVRKAKVGDQVVLKTTEALKSGGNTLVEKGALLRGHVTDVQRKARGKGESSISMVFDRLEKGSLMIPITATISSITTAGGSLDTNNDLFGADTSSRTSASTRSSTSSSSSGGLLGGVTGTVGSVLNTTTGTVGGVVNATGETVGNTTNAVGNTVSGLRISQPVNASASGESTLSLSGGNLRLEKGTSVRVVLDQAVGTNINQ